MEGSSVLIQYISSLYWTNRVAIIYNALDKIYCTRLFMEEKKVRSSNIELLRIVAMLMIVIYHIVCHCVIPQLTDSASIERMGNGYFNVPAFYKKLLIVDLIDPWGQISNAIFILISGYFMVSKG